MQLHGKEHELLPPDATNKESLTLSASEALPSGSGDGAKSSASLSASEALHVPSGSCDETKSSATSSASEALPSGSGDKAKSSATDLEPTVKRFKGSVSSPPPSDEEVKVVNR